MKKERYTEYDPFAVIYNQHWGFMFTPTAMTAIEKLVLSILPQGAAILDLCCGTGQIAEILKGQGYRVTGIDGSEKMLAYARENAPGVHFLADDARSFAIDTTFDAIVCVFDSLNHIMSLKELGDVFKSVYRALKDNGVFHFDMNLEAEYTDHWSGVHGIVEDEQVCVIRLNYDAETRTGVFDATLFLLAEGWRRTDFVLKQKWYPESDINKELEKAGFKTVEIYNFDQEKNLTELSPEARRAFFRCIK